MPREKGVPEIAACGHKFLFPSYIYKRMYAGAFLRRARSLAADLHAGGALWKRIREWRIRSF